MTSSIITAAQSRLIRHIRTPVIHSAKLSSLLGNGKQVFLKLDNAQLSSSFKDRGFANLINHHTHADNPQKVRTLISSSAGNAGLAVATLVNKYNRIRGLSPDDEASPDYLKCEVFTPQNTPEMAIQCMKLANATVHNNDPCLESAHQTAMQRVRELESQNEHSVFCHPFDHPLLWDGYSTIIDELMEDLNEELQRGDPCVVCSVGGGGLLNGIALGLRRNGLSERVSVITAETLGCHSFFLSNRAGELRTLKKATSIANTLGVATPQAQSLEISKKHTKQTFSMVVSDKQAVSAMKRFLDDHRVLVEPACAASLALVYEESKRSVFDGFDTIVIEICGGNGISLEKLLQLCDSFEL